MPAFFPICIVLKPDSVSTPKRIVPFDSGAFEDGRFSEHMHPKMRRDDFFLEPVPDMPSRLVSRFYGSNDAYFSGKPHTIQIPPIEFEALSYYNLISSQNVSNYDDRNSSIEIQSGTNLALDSSNVLLIVLPTVFLDVDFFRDRIVRDWRAQIRTYELYRCNPNEYTMLIYREVDAYLRDGNLL